MVDTVFAEHTFQKTVPTNVGAYSFFSCIHHNLYAQFFIVRQISIKKKDVKNVFFLKRVFF